MAVVKIGNARIRPEMVSFMQSVFYGGGEYETFIHFMGGGSITVQLSGEKVEALLWPSFDPNPEAYLGSP